MKAHPRPPTKPFSCAKGSTKLYDKEITVTFSCAAHTLLLLFLHRARRKPQPAIKGKCGIKIYLFSIPVSHFLLLLSLSLPLFVSVFLIGASETADTLFQEVLGRKDKADSTRNALNVLQRFKFLFNLPLNIERNIQKVLFTHKSLHADTKQKQKDNKK